MDNAPRVPAALKLDPVSVPTSDIPSDLDIGAAIASVWCRILGTDAVGQKDNFFDLGGHSLLAVQTHRELRDALGFKGLSITDIFRFPVLGDLVARVESLTGAKTPSAATNQTPSQAPARPLTAPAAAPVAPVAQVLETTNERSLARHAAMTKRRAMRASRKEKQL